MARYIDATQLQAKILDASIKNKLSESREVLKIFDKMVQDMPTADVVPRNQWISIEDRLPEEDTRVLVYLNIQKTDANLYTFFDTDRILDGKWVRWRGYISHWMSLPAPPTEKEN